MTTLTTFALSISLALSATSSLAKPFYHEFGELRQYHDHWLSVCPDNVDFSSQEDYKRACWASTYTGENGSFSGSFPGNRLSVIRDRANGELSITFSSDVMENIAKDRRAAFTFSDGSFETFAIGSEVTNYENVINEFTFADQATAERIIAKMRRANHMTILMPLRNGGTSKQFHSLKGLVSAMNFLKKYAK